jgi:hypothetical protein
LFCGVFAQVKACIRLHGVRGVSTLAGRRR